MLVLTYKFVLDVAPQLAHLALIRFRNPFGGTNIANTATTAAAAATTAAATTAAATTTAIITNFAKFCLYILVTDMQSRC